MNRPVFFNEALQRAAGIVQSHTSSEKSLSVIRDVYGRLRFVVNCNQNQFSPESKTEIEAEITEKLGQHAGSSALLFKNDFSDPRQVFEHPDWQNVIVPDTETTISLLDRQIIGQDWRNVSEASFTTPRIVFYGVKGGVGRSTALAILAYQLAQEGKKVLLLDFDLESPGVASLLLPPERMTEFGLVDWFIEDAVNQGEYVHHNLLADSPLAEHATGTLRIASAMGRAEYAYLDKLARIYADVPKETGTEHFAQRMVRLVATLEAQEQPDIILIDSRAGLHDLAAISIATLASHTLLFATDTVQSWQGYQQLFGHWQRCPTTARQIRERLHLVQALFPENDQQNRAERFLECSFDLFRERLYDELPPDEKDTANVFSFDLDEKEAPHIPLRVLWNARFQEFNPCLSFERGGLDADQIGFTFGPFIKAVKAIAFPDE